ncbi:MAG: hypothetical protein M0R37_13930 [Bacteroidales bacterium]|nr:hypothetical protein [Bacteroidales bacterium]
MFLPLQRDLATGRVNPDAFARHVSELLGQPAPGQEARQLTELAWGEWRATGELRWLSAIGSIDARLVQCEDLVARMGDRDGLRAWRSVKHYWAWRGRWLGLRAPDEATFQAIAAVAAERAARLDAKEPAEVRPSRGRPLSSSQRRAQKREREYAKALEVFRRGAARMAQSLADQGKAP